MYKFNYLVVKKFIKSFNVIISLTNALLNILLNIVCYFRKHFNSIFFFLPKKVFLSG